ncbi:hypothetical protein IGI04_014426 [Brassica rapa subsp. trilocularis]|uniref:AAA+ ATPase At3g28540-like C-terminal domain-containing protein n=1 Tax=Brassica rapa subsp. trilocularis TaxID=1813537 RepID=A0ABQ7MM71_BRACM|nr:hypothetical protein IGI04_014426 [Brassica rapa subsp. trilocularis]
MQNNLELRKPLTATSSKFSIVIKDIDYSVDLTCKRRKTKTGLFSKKDGKKGQEDLNQSRVLAKNYLDLDSHPLFLEIESLLRETKIAPADVAGKLMAKNHKKDVDGSLKDLVQSLVTRKTYHTSHSDDHNKKPSGKKRKSISWISDGFYYGHKT